MEGNGQWKRWAGGAFMIDQVVFFGFLQLL
jgi:hypothetical protein